MTGSARSKFRMSDEHKALLAQGRAEGRIVRVYLEALASLSERRPSRRTRAAMESRLAAIEEEIAAANAIERLKLAQERRDLSNALADLEPEVDMEALETSFVEIAASYGARQGISYETWREVGVPAGVLNRAGIARGRGGPASADEPGSSARSRPPRSQA